MSRPILPNPNLPSDASEQEMLSAYLDNVLPEIERAALEQRLNVEPALRTELESLRRTLALLNNAPVLAPPRNFTLDPAQYHRSTPHTRRIIWLPVGAIGAAAAILLVALIASQSLSGVTSQTYHTISITGTPMPIAIVPTVLPTGVALQSNSPVALPTGTPKAGVAATQSAADSAIRASTTSNQAPLIAAPLRPTTTAVTMTPAQEVATIAPSPEVTIVTQAANSSVAPSANGAINASGGVAGPSVLAPGSPPSVVPGALLAPATQVSQSIPLTANELATVAIVIRWLLIILGVKGLS